MAKPLSELKRFEIGKLVLLGETFDRIAAQTGVGKGTVVSISRDLRAGRIPGLQKFAEQAEEMRSLAADLRKGGVPLEQAILGFAFFRRLAVMGVPMEEIESWADFCKEFTPAGAPPEPFMEAVLEVQRFKTERGFSLEDLDQKLEEGRELLAALATEEEATTTRIKALKKELVVLEAKEAGSKVRAAGLKEQGNQARIAAERAEKNVRELAEAQGRVEATLKGLEFSIQEKESRVPDLERTHDDLVARVGESKRLIGVLSEAGFGEDDLAILAAALTKMAAAKGLPPGRVKTAFFADLKGYPFALRFRALRDSLKREARKHLTKARNLRSELKNGKTELSALETGRAKLAEEVALLRGEKDEIGAGIRAVCETCEQGVRGILKGMEDDVARLGAMLQESGRFERELELARFLLAGEEALKSTASENVRFWLGRILRWAALRGLSREHKMPKAFHDKAYYASTTRLTLAEILSWALEALDSEYK